MGTIFQNDRRDSSIRSAAPITVRSGDDNILATQKPVVEPFYVGPFFRNLQARIDAVHPEERCAAFGARPLHTALSPRRLFFGTLLSNENIEVLKALAIESHGVYDVMAFVEANTTFMATPRTLKFKGTPEADMLKHSNMFGNKTAVHFEYWLHDWPTLIGMDREAEQRDTITNMWKEAGMTEQDVGIVADVDEIVSRDYLRALQVCDFPQLRKEKSPSCHTPKIRMTTIQFEATPYCIKKKSWYHPDVILGQCIDGIGNPLGRVKAQKRQDNGQFGQRAKHYGQSGPDNYPWYIMQSNKFPLWSANDFRTVPVSTVMANYQEGHRRRRSTKAAFGVAYHLHNWFTDLSVLRNKYATYGHPVADAKRIKLHDIDVDLDIMLRCLHGVANTNHGGIVANNHSQHDNRWYVHDGNVTQFWLNHGGPKPLYFMNQTWSQKRHEWLKDIVAQDEAMYGSNYSSITS
ncbi:MAG: hypothetical protein SGILL_003478 [Bacillariaceae sp.]